MADSTQDLDKIFKDIYGARITPYPMLFCNVHRNKIYTKKISIQNISQHILSIRILPPTNKSLTINSIPKPRDLCPGLSLLRSITLKYDDQAPDDSIIQIVVNERIIDYYLIIKPPVAEISCEPQTIDFGIVDAGFSSAVRKLTLRNDGSKTTSFCIDFGHAIHNLLVEPNKGVVKGKRSVSIYITIIAMNEDIVRTELHILAGKKFVIPVSARVIMPRLEANHPNRTENFTFLVFPSTYVGLKSIQYLFVTNYSSNPCMFQMLGEVGNKTVPLDQYQEVSSDFEMFHIFPENGTFTSNETRIFNITFAPKHCLKESQQTHYFSTLLISRFIFRTNDPDDFKDTFSIHSDKVSLGSTSNLRSDSLTQTASSIILSPFRDRSKDMSTLIENFRKSFIRIYMYGVAEEPSVTTAPDQILLKDLKIHQRETRTLMLINKSSRLPIIFHYKKVPFIDLEKRSYFLNPAQKIEINIFITPQNIGRVKTNIEFDLVFKNLSEECYKTIGQTVVPVIFHACAVKVSNRIYLNPGLKPNYLKEVGKNCQEINFSTTIPKMKAITVDVVEAIDKNCTDLVAFPNDRQRSLRPWRLQIPCKTIFSKQARYIAPVNAEYELRVADREFKRKIANYYTNYVRSEVAKLKETISAKNRNVEYLLTDKQKILCQDLQLLHSSSIKLPPKMIEEYIPLGPLEMSKINTIPSVVETSPIACNSTYQFKLIIINNNSFTIKVLIRPDKRNITCCDLSRKHCKIDGFSRTEIEFLFKSTWSGFYASTISLCVNDSIIIPVDVLVNVKPRSLNLSTNILCFTAEDTKKYIDIINPLNITIPFSWIASTSNFIVIPTFGAVEAYSVLTAQVSYVLNSDGPNEATLEFHSGERTIVEVKVFTQEGRRRIIVETPEVQFENVPLNCLVFRKVLLKNLETYNVSFNVLDIGLSDDIKIFPKQCSIKAKSKMAIYVTAVFKNCVNLDIFVYIQIVNGKRIALPVKANVIYPDVTIFPMSITVPKITACSTSNRMITITNSSLATAYVKFDMSGYADFKISESENYWDDGLKGNIILATKQSKKIYLHFIPSSAMSIHFYLPIILNGIIGPPLLHDTITTRNVYYLTNSTNVSITMPCVKVRALATEPPVLFSNYCICFDLPPWKSEKVYTVKVSNLQNQKEDIYLASDNLVQPFEVDYHSGSPIQKLQRAIFISLEPKEETVLAVKFKPTVYGSYKILLPIFLRRCNGPEYQRAWIIKGVSIEPSIEFERCVYSIRKTIISTLSLDQHEIVVLPNTKIFFCRPLPLEVQCLSSKKFLFKNHLEGCTTRASTDLNFLTITIKVNTIKKVSSVDYIIKVTFLCSPTENICYRGTVNIECSCGGHWNALVIGCAENSFLTSYAFCESFHVNKFDKSDSISANRYQISYTDISLKSFDPGHSDVIFGTGRTYSVEFFSSYPFFPTQEGPLLTFLLKTLNICERWIYTQGFFQTLSFNIPTGILHIEVKRKGTKSIKTTVFVPFAQLLINLVGSQVAEYLDLKQDPEKDFGTLEALLALYQRALDFLAKRGAYFTYLRPEHLLAYSDFLKYQEQILPTEANPSLITTGLNNVELFYHFSKQCWLDLLLQTYKVLCLQRLEENFRSRMREKREDVDHPFEEFLESMRNITNYSNIFSLPEVLIMRWLAYHYNTSKDIFWPEVNLQQKDVNIFGEGFADGLVFIAITLIYCPYVKSYLQNIYAPPNSTEQMNHNYNKLLNVWQKLMFSYQMSAGDFMTFHSIQLLMFSAYLYDVLPHMYPTQTIELKAGLSQRKQFVLELTNINRFSIAYKPIIIPFGSNDFTTDKNIYIVKPNGSCNIIVTYYAKFAKITKATLLLSGECPGYHYSKNKALNIIGMPDLSYMSTTITYPVKLYECTHVQFTVTSPYAKEATYELQMSYEPLKTVEELDAVIYHQDLHKLKSGRFTPLDRSYSFDENGLCTIHGILTTIRNVDMYVYLFLKNPKVGDFTILVSLIISGKVQEEPLLVQLPKVIDVDKPLDILKIPCRNRLFWNAVRDLIHEITDGSERLFWEKVVDSSPGMQFVSKLLTDNQMIPKTATARITSCQSMIYKVTYQTSDVVLPKYITIDQECDSGFVNVPITLLRTYPKDFSFLMSTEDGIERAYYVQFSPHAKQV